MGLRNVQYTIPAKRCLPVHFNFNLKLMQVRKAINLIYSFQHMAVLKSLCILNALFRFLILVRIKKCNMTQPKDCKNSVSNII